MILPASYSNGFAPRDGQPLYPELWRGCVGAWAPCLGPSGLVLRDWSGFGRHGTLTNFTPDSAWNIKSRWSLGFDGVNDYVSLPSISASVWSFSCWVWLRAITATGFDRLFAQNNFQCEIGIDGFGKVNVYDGTAWRGFPSVLSVGTWYNVICTFNGAQLECHINGTPNGSAISGGRAISGVSFIGAAYLFNNQDSLDGSIGEIRVYDRIVSVNEIRTLSTRPGIAYELAPRRRSRVSVLTSLRYNIFTGNVGSLEVIGAS